MKFRLMFTRVAAGSAILALFLMVTAGPAFSQDKQDPSVKAQAPKSTLTADKAASLKKILSKYNPAKLTEADAKAIHDQFRQYGIHGGPETNDAIRAAGFDPDKLRALDPPPDQDKQTRHGPPSQEEMLKNLETNILKPMSLNASQHDVVVKAYKEFYTDMTALRNAQEPGGGPPDRTKFDQIRQTRDNKIKKVLTADQFKKFQDLEQANRPNRQGGQPPAKN